MTKNGFCLFYLKCLRGTSYLHGQDMKIFRYKTNIYPLRFAEMGSDILNSKVAPLAEKALAALNLGKRAFKFTKIQLGSVKPKFTNIRSFKYCCENLSNKKQLQDSQEEP